MSRLVWIRKKKKKHEKKEKLFFPFAFIKVKILTTKKKTMNDVIGIGNNKYVMIRIMIHVACLLRDLIAPIINHRATSIWSKFKIEMKFIDFHVSIDECVEYGLNDFVIIIIIASEVSSIKGTYADALYTFMYYRHHHRPQ